MTVQYDIQILRSKLLAMTRLTQRGVDYSIKAMQLGRPELVRMARDPSDEISAIRCWIASHGPTLLAAETTAKFDARFACAALRISGALKAAHDSAIEIAQQGDTHSAAGCTPVSAELEDAGHFVNSLLRLCVVSLLKRTARHAKRALLDVGAGESLDPAVHLAHYGRAPLAGAQVRCEQAIVRSLDRIASQVREIADSIVLWLDEDGRAEAASQAIARTTLHVAVGLASGACAVRISEVVLPCKTPGLRGSVLPRKALRLNPSVDSFVQRGNVEAAPDEDDTETRLVGLQRRVCELLIKNQVLRMALLAAKVDHSAINSVEWHGRDPTMI